MTNSSTVNQKETVLNANKISSLPVVNDEQILIYIVRIRDL
jgi:hypothetical protein